MLIFSSDHFPLQIFTISEKVAAVDAGTASSYSDGSNLASIATPVLSFTFILAEPVGPATMVHRA